MDRGKWWRWIRFFLLATLAAGALVPKDGRHRRLTGAGRAGIQDCGRGVAQLGLERHVRDVEVAGSNPVAPTTRKETFGIFRRCKSFRLQVILVESN